MLGQLAEADPLAYRPHVARTLNSLAALYTRPDSETQRLKEAEGAYQEALTISQRRARTNAPAYWPNVVATLNKLADLALTQGNTILAQE
jgi:hypothetical protein